MDDLIGVISLYHPTLQSVIFALAAGVFGGTFFAYTTGYLLWLTPEQRVSTFIVGFALTSAFVVGQLGQPLADWREALLFDSLPLLVCFAYFFPTIVAVAAGCTIFRAVFVVNLFFGWTIVGWFTAMVMAFRPSEHDVYDDLDIRLTPFGAVAKSSGAPAVQQLPDVQLGHRVALSGI
jgi:hypothetical protein